MRYPLNRRAFATAINEPISHVQAIEHHEWKEATETEYNALLKNGTWSLVPRHESQNIIECKWVFKVKQKSDGTIDRYKELLVAKGFKQRYGIDYANTCSPVVKSTTIHLILFIAVSRGWNLRKIDVQNVFLHGVLQEEVYMQQPPRFEDGGHPRYVCRLQKALYGLKQAPQTWYARLSTKLQELGFVPSRADVSLFVFNKENKTIYILIYVDDIVIACSCGKSIDKLIQQLSRNFAIKDLGQLSYFLGIEAILKECDSKRSLIQRKCISDLLKKENMLNCKSADTAMSSSDKLSKIQGETLSEDDTFMYRG